MKEASAKRIIVEMEDGEEKVIEKGTAIEFEGDTIEMKMVQVSKSDLVKLTYGLISMMDELGLMDVLTAMLNGEEIED